MVEELMTAEGVAKLLSVTPSWVKKKSRPHVAESERIPSIKLGKMVRYRMSDIQAWLNSQCSVKL